MHNKWVLFPRLIFSLEPVKVQRENILFQICTTTGPLPWISFPSKTSQAAMRKYTVSNLLIINELEKSITNREIINIRPLQFTILELHPIKHV